MGKLFTPGQLAIDQLITSEAGGKSPQFYGFLSEGDPVKITEANLNNTYEAIGFELKLARIREVVVSGLDSEIPDTDTVIPLPMFPPNIGRDIYGLYHKP
jgi:hypothetical protein